MADSQQGPTARYTNASQPTIILIYGGASIAIKDNGDDRSWSGRKILGSSGVLRILRNTIEAISQCVLYDVNVRGDQ
jgi:hypothetical protein